MLVAFVKKSRARTFWPQMLRIGKHTGKRFEDVAAVDRGYCVWVLREKALPLRAFYQYLINVHGGILNVGKHKGRFFDEVLEGAPTYCAWALSLDEPSESLRLFIDYLRVHYHGTRRSLESPNKKARADSNFCFLCCDRPVDTAFVPCGHLASCMPCASSFDGHPCPICRRQVAFVLKTYSA